VAGHVTDLEFYARRKRPFQPIDVLVEDGCPRTGRSRIELRKGTPAPPNVALVKGPSGFSRHNPVVLLRHISAREKRSEHSAIHVVH